MKNRSIFAIFNIKVYDLILHSSLQDSQTELTDMLNEFLGTLPKEKRLIFLRRYWYGDSISEIAKAFHCREGRIRTTLSRIRKKLEKFLKERGVSYERKGLAQIHDSY